jgi:hypothetical protein
MGVVVQRAILGVVALSCRMVSVHAAAWSIVLAGGTGPVGQMVASKLAAAVVADDDDHHHQQYDVTILARNAFLAATPSRVTQDYGWVGARFLAQNRPHVRLRDWDGGDLLDIVGRDWMGWQQDTLSSADVVVHLTGGGFTQQRVMACERLVRESLLFNAKALHVTVNPTNELLARLSPGLQSIKQQRIASCEEMVRANCDNHVCIRSNDKKIDAVCDAILVAIADWEGRRV